MAVFTDRRTGRTQELYGAGDVAAMFGDSPKVGVPWKQAIQRRHNHAYDKGLVTAELSRPPSELTAVDPRNLQATQPHLVRAGVAHYMGEQFRTTGETFADQHNVGNQYPFVYGRHREGEEGTDEILLSGHHRAAAALLKGEPLMARRVEGGWGARR